MPQITQPLFVNEFLKCLIFKWVNKILYCKYKLIYENWPTLNSNIYVSYCGAMQGGAYGAEVSPWLKKVKICKYHKNKLEENYINPQTYCNFCYIFFQNAQICFELLSCFKNYNILWLKSQNPQINWRNGEMFFGNDGMEMDMIQHCEYSKWLECLPKHDGAINCYNQTTIRRNIIFVKT